MSNLTLVTSAPVDSYDAYLSETFKSLKHHTSAFGDALYVTFRIDAKEWKRLQTKGHLGQLYGIDLSNYLSRRGILKKYCVPVVDDKIRARAGIKLITVTYYLDR